MNKKISKIIFLVGFMSITSNIFSQNNPEKSIDDLMQKLKQVVKEKKIKNFYFNFDEIIEKTVVDSPFQIGIWETVDTINGSTELQMLEKGQRLYFSQAIMVLIAEIENGGFDEIPTYKLIFLKEETLDGLPLALACNRPENKHFRVYIRPIKPLVTWDKGRNSWLTIN